MGKEETYHFIVIGLGAHGSSALYYLAKTGKKVAGIDRFRPPHQQGSSHGESRIIRQAYHENPLYVPLVKAAYPLWTEIEKITGKTLYRKTGGLMLGRRDSVVVEGAHLSARTHGIPFDYLEAADLRRRFPAFRPDGDTVGILEKEAGILFPEECIRAWLSAAAARGAVVRTDERVLSIRPLSSRVELTTSLGSYIAEKIIVAAGAWTGSLLAGLDLPLTVERQVLYWFDNAELSSRPFFHPGKMPIFIWEYLPGKLFYGVPDIGTGVKVAHHHRGRTIRPDELQPDVSADEITEMTSVAGRYLSMKPLFLRASVCMYTNTPDEDFIIDFHPGHRNILIASPCSGHGFKFSSVTGKLLCELVTEGRTDFDLSPFAIGRAALRR